MLLSGHILIRSGGGECDLQCFETIDRSFDIISVISVISLHGFPLIARKILSRRAERQLGIRAAGVDVQHGFSIILLLSVLCYKSKPRVGSIHLIETVMSTDGLSGLEAMSK